MTSLLSPSATAIGRYFTVVSFIPSAVFVAYVIIVARSGAFGGDIDIAGAVRGLGLADAVLFGVASLLVALAMHPLQYALIQTFEGYWGDTAFGRRLALQHILRHRRRAKAWKRSAANSERASRPEPVVDATGRVRPRSPYAAARNATAGQVASFFMSSESWRIYGNYPENAEYIMPTRLGNTLRRYELLAGSRYGLDSISVVPRLMQVADARDVAYVHDQRIQMELALRTCGLALAATALTVVAMWQHGLLMAASLIPYALAYASYRGAVVVSHEYGTALAVLVDLNRFALYERLRLPHPDDIEGERESNEHLTSVLRLDNAFIKQRQAETAFLDYVEPRPDSVPWLPGASPSQLASPPQPPATDAGAGT